MCKISLTFKNPLKFKPGRNGCTETLVVIWKRNRKQNLNNFYISIGGKLKPARLYKQTAGILCANCVAIANSLKQ